MPFAGGAHAAFIQMDTGGTLRPEKRYGLNRCSMTAEVEVGGTPFDLGAEKQVKEDVAVVHATDGAIGVHLYSEA
ncbi:MAG: hypothetical protein ABF292_05390 [Desulfobacterales bacterium]